ncbi:MerR family transcriptional regulator [Bacillus sp. C1]
MFKIGDFSKLSSISIRMLRYYDKMELLVPEKIDPQTGYRYYSAAQLKKVNQIQHLKVMGFGIPAMKEIIDNHGNRESIKKYYINRSSQLQEEMKHLQKQLRLLEDSIRTIREDVVEMSYYVSMKEIPARRVASVRKVIPTYHCENTLWDILVQEIRLQHIDIGNPRYGLAIFHDHEYKEKDVDVEIQMNVAGEYKNTKDVMFKHVDSSLVASITVNGNYEQIPAVNEAAAKWIETERYELAGPMFNIYHVSPATEEDPDKWVTEVCYPIKK